MVPKLKFLTVLFLLFTTLTGIVAAQATLQAVASFNANLRCGPDSSYLIVGSAPTGTVATVEARSADSAWILVRLPSQVRGWAQTRQWALDGDLATLPVSSEIVASAGSAPAPAAATQVGAPAQPPAANTAGKLTFAAQITPAVRSTMRAVYLRGLARGNNPHVFSRIGDCLVGHVWFLFPFGTGQPYDLGDYGYLQAVINNFMASPRPGVANSFVTIGQAARSAFTSGSVLDPAWADPGLCQPGESPLLCEFRTAKPSVAFVMFGVVDVAAMSADDFGRILPQVIQQSLSNGVIPIMSTAPENPAFAAKAQRFNQIVISVAQRYRVPLINLRDALADLPNHGLDPDGIHLTPGASYVGGSFARQRLQEGFTLWNLLALQSLDTVWRQIMN
jgi:uncharacterized protein YraI